MSIQNTIAYHTKCVCFCGNNNLCVCVCVDRRVAGVHKWIGVNVRLHILSISAWWTILTVSLLHFLSLSPTFAHSYPHLQLSHFSSMSFSIQHEAVILSDLHQPIDSQIFARPRTNACMPISLLSPTLNPLANLFCSSDRFFSSK